MWIPPISLSILPFLNSHWMNEALINIELSTCRKSDFWIPNYANVIIGTYIFLPTMMISTGLAINLARKCSNGRFKTTCKVNYNVFLDDTLPLCPGNSRRLKAAMVVRTVDTTPLNLSYSKSSIINFMTSMAFTLPAILYYGNFARDESENMEER